MINKATIGSILKKFWVSAAILIICAAVVSSIVRSLTPWANEHKKDVEYHLTQLIGQPVTVHRLETGWYWFHPVLKLDRVTIKGKQDSIHLGKLYVGVNLFKSLIHWRIQPGLLYLQDAHLSVRKKGAQWSLDGIDLPQSQIPLPELFQQLILQLAQQDRLIIKDFSVDIYSNSNKLIPARELNLSIVNSSGNYKIKGLANIGQQAETSFKLWADIAFDPLNYKKTQGRVYFETKNLTLTPLQELLPHTQHYVDKGDGSLALWVDLYNGELSAAQAQLSLNQLTWTSVTRQKESISSFYANMSWKPDNKGWRFNADHIQLRMDEHTWPENQVLVQFDRAQQTYLLFTKSIIIEPLLNKLAHQWPEQARKITALKPRGILTDFQLVLKNKQPSYLLTRFDQLSWQEQGKIPGVNHLSGVIQWEPQEGHLELDSENTVIAIKGYPKQNLTLLNGVVDWKELSNGLRVSIDRFALSQPELTISFQGVVDGLSQQSMGTIRLGLDFSAKNIQQWMSYLPKAHMKPKLYNWLNQDIKKIAQATGKVIINGAASDFPFDNHNGEFSIISHAVGGEVLITPKWKLISDLEGYVRLKNRNLEIDIVNGEAEGVPLKQMHLRIDDIGKDKETLLIHSVVEGPAQKMVDFILASPLKEKLAKLKMLAIKGLFYLDLNLEIPLYPENDVNLVKGIVTFKNNLILIRHQIAAIPIDEIKGTLSFDEEGVTQSTLAGTAFDYPLDIKVSSVKSPKPTTLISIIGECTVESLKNKFKFPIMSLLKGSFSLNALLKITADPNDLDNLTVNSSLEGLAINVPAPLGKKHKEHAPLTVELDFNAEKALRLKANYNQKLSTDIWFEQNKNKEFVLKSGQISLGADPAVDQKTPGLAITGSLDGFNIEQWNHVVRQFSSKKNSSSFFSKLRHFNLKLKRFVFLQQQFDDISLKGSLLPSQDWTFNIEQKKISADLTYYASKNLLSGFVRYLHLDKIKSSGNKSSEVKRKPSQIPNLNLRIDNLMVGTTLVGNVTLKSHSSEERWVIDYCRIDSPVYQFMVGGEWIQKNNTNRTNAQVKLHFNNLAKSLEHWNITPAVDASKGDLVFNGGWNGSIYDFSLPALKGSMYLQLNNGRITHLSPETEEKLGLGKLLSILSLQTIPRRLTLDFSDLSQDGYSFDVFKGDFNLNKGIMNTQNSYIDGPVAYASMKGDLDIVRRMYDLDLSISPHITASLPVVATIAGGPIAGLAAWVASKIINQSMQKITAYSYKISGPWDAPVVQQLSIIKKTTKK